MFATRKFRDFTSFLQSGLPPGNYSIATSGSPIPWSHFRKLEWVMQIGSAGSANAEFGLLFQTASASAAATWTTRGYLGATGFTSVATLLPTSVYSNQVLPVDMRGEWLYSVLYGTSANYSAGGNYIPWILPVYSGSNSSTCCALLAMGFLHDYGPAWNYDWPSTGYVAYAGSAEQDAY